MSDVECNGFDQLVEELVCAMVTEAKRSVRVCSGSAGLDVSRVVKYVDGGSAGSTGEQFYVVLSSAGDAEHVIGVECDCASVMQPLTDQLERESLALGKVDDSEMEARAMLCLALRDGDVVDWMSERCLTVVPPL